MNFSKQKLAKITIKNIGKGKTKPFECVGTYEEVNCAISKVIKDLENDNKELPYLLKFYKDNYEVKDISDELLARYNNENNLSEELEIILKGAIYDK